MYNRIEWLIDNEDRDKAYEAINKERDTFGQYDAKFQIKNVSIDADGCLRLHIKLIKDKE